MSKQAAANAPAAGSSGDGGSAEGAAQGSGNGADDLAAAAAVAALAGLVPPSAAVGALSAAAGTATPAAGGHLLAADAAGSGSILPPLPTGGLELPPLPVGGLFGPAGGLPFGGMAPFEWFTPQQLPPLPLPLPQPAAGKRARKPSQKYQEANDVLAALQQALQPASPDAEDTVSRRRAAGAQRSRGSSGSRGSRGSSDGGDGGEGGSSGDASASQAEPGSSGSDDASEEPDGEAGEAGDEPAPKRRRVGKPRQKLNKAVEPVGKRKFTASEITLEILESEVRGWVGEEGSGQGLPRGRCRSGGGCGMFGFGCRQRRAGRAGIGCSVACVPSLVQGCFDLDQLSAARRLGFTSPTTLKVRPPSPTLQLCPCMMTDVPYLLKKRRKGERKGEKPPNHAYYLDFFTVSQKEMARLGLSDWPYRTRATIGGIRKNLQVSHGGCSS